MANKPTADSKATMIKRSIKEGVKSAIRSVSGSGAAKKASDAQRAKTAKTRKKIEEE